MRVELPAAETRPASTIDFEEITPGEMQIFARVLCGRDGQDRRMILGRVSECRTLNPLVQFFSPMGADLIVELAQLVQDRTHLGH